VYFIQQILHQILSNITYSILTLVTIVTTAIGSVFLWRWSWKWVVAILLILLLGAFFWVALRYPAQGFLRTDLPSLFLDHFWAWVFVLTVGVFWSFFTLVRLLRSPRPGPMAPVQPEAEAQAEMGAMAPGFPDLDAAWDAIQIRMSQAQIDLGRQRITLLIAPHEDWSAALIQSAGLQLFAQAPETAAPIHAYATAEGVLLSCAAASAYGTQEAGGASRLEHLCQRLLALQPDCPAVRGVAVVFPLSWALQPDAPRRAASVREDLQTIRRVLKVRCPAFALFTEMETVPGFTEFLRRMDRVFRDSRVGFAAPRAQAFSADLVGRGLAWLSSWFHNWILSHLSNDLFNHAGNDHLLSLDHAVRHHRDQMRKILDAAFSTHRGTEPNLYRGCYLMATGQTPDEQAFAAGLFRGARGRVLTEHLATEWTLEAIDDDRRYRRMAWNLASVSGVLMLAWWLYILDQVRFSPHRWLLWTTLAGVAVVWVYAIIRLRRL
jgi:type VI protein secretion system component VasK